MNLSDFPIPPTHKKFIFGKVVIDSNFDNGNCSFAEKVNTSTYSIWIGADHPKNIYRMWFYFSIEGISKGTMINFQIKNMQNQAKLLYDGLAPVVKDQAEGEWKRISHKINFTDIIFGENQFQWTFTHQFGSNQKHFFAFYYPWSNKDNESFIRDVQYRAESNQEVYFHKGTIANTIEGRPILMLTISSKKGLVQKQQTFDDLNLFCDSSRPKKFEGDKRIIVIGARVHPGQVPGSHVMTGIIDQLTKDNLIGKILRDNFIFYIFPILNPDGVGRGHFRVDTNGINLNRCYLNPSLKQHGSIYAIKRVIMHSHLSGRYFAFLDLHAQASRKGNFLYGNSTNSLTKQVQACLFAKILSLNSENFQYQGSNFMEKHMYCRDKADHMSKQGCGRVAIYHATKNPNSWTLECSYNMGQRLNILQSQKDEEDQPIQIDPQNLDQNIIKNYKVFPFKETQQFFTIDSYRKLGKEILVSFLDLIEKHPYSRITNPNNYFKNIANIKLNLAVALTKMSPNRFQPYFRKIFFLLQTQNQKIVHRCFKALYFLIIKRASLPKITQFLREQDHTIIFPSEQSITLKTRSSNKKVASRYNQKGTLSQNQAKMKAKLIAEDNFIELQSSESIIMTTEDSPQKCTSSISPLNSSHSRNQRKQKNAINAVVKIVEIDKQIYLRQAAKQSIRLFSINQLQTRYESHAQIANFANFRNKDKLKHQSHDMRATYQQAFRLNVLPKLMATHKFVLNSGFSLKHHNSFK